MKLGLGILLLAANAVHLFDRQWMSKRCTALEARSKVPSPSNECLHTTVQPMTRGQGQTVQFEFQRPQAAGMGHLAWKSCLLPPMLYISLFFNG